MERAANIWMNKWSLNNPGMDAHEAWLALTPETKGHLMAISDMELRIFENVRKKVLEALDAFHDPDSVKEPFREAVRNVKL